MKRYLIFAIAAIVVAMVGCKKDDTKGDAPEEIWPDAPIIDSSKIEPYTDYLIRKWDTPSRHFINSYLVPHKMDVFYEILVGLDSISPDEFPCDGRFEICFLYNLADKIYSASDAEFKDKALAIKDYYYFQNYYIRTINPKNIYENYEYFDAILYGNKHHITVTTLTDFDAAHPAGSSLEDIVRVEAYTALPFIESQYTKLEQGDYLRNNIKCSLTEFNARNYDLVRSCISLTITSKPAPSDDIRLEFTYRTSDGVSLTHQLYPLRYQD